MKYRNLAFTMAASLALMTIALPAGANAHDPRPRVFTPDNAPVVHTGRHHGRSRSATDGRGQQIACTILGCAPIPRNCRVGTGYNWRDEPTGYDVAVCP
jgi:hypothetical protein